MKIGNNLDTKEDAKIDLVNLIETRLLITANSGGGKSWCIRKIVEESHEKVQQIIIDLEGEFTTLREEFDFILVGKEGEIPVTIKTAELLAKKLLELNTSAIIDLSELQQHERIIYVKRFLDSMIDSPKNLWHPVMVIVDEAHHFCPESSKSESASAVIDLMTRGRKRGFAGILATQRISKLNKDAIAEANNYMIGRTGLDIDMKRASEILGFTTKEQMRSLRELDAGKFFTFGPSVSKEVTRIKVGNVKTKHLKSGGQQLIKVAPPSDKIKRILQKVTDLPKEAEIELKTKADFQELINRQKRDISILKQNKPIINSDSKALEASRLQGKRESDLLYQDKVRYLEGAYKVLEKDLTKSKSVFDNIAKLCSTMINIQPAKLEFKPVARVIPPPTKQVTNRIQPVTTNSQDNEIKPLREGAMKMLGWLAAFYPESLTKEKVATLSGFSVRGGTFNIYLSELKRNNWISENGELSITEDGLSNARNVPEKPTNPQEFIELWAGKFREGAAKILRLVCEQYPNAMTKEEIGESTGFAPEGGTFNIYISELRRNGLIKIDSQGIVASSELFE